MQKYFCCDLGNLKGRVPMQGDYSSSLSKSKKREGYFIENGARLLKELISSSDGKANPIRMFSAEELERATDNYSDSHILVKGGMYTAYRGTLEGRPIVIRRVNTVFDFCIDNVFNEIIMLSQINHKNVVKLFGCCIETRDPRPVYEFISNGNLYNQLRSNHINIPWECRVRIATEVASAISYLHLRSSKPIVHRDIRSLNILLDDHYTAKLANFGNSEMIVLDEKEFKELNTKGTNGQANVSNFLRYDVRSFGVVLVDLLCGKMTKLILSSDKCGLLDWVDHLISYIEEKRLLLQLGSGILEEGKQDELLQWIACAELAVRCIEDGGLMMKEVVQELRRICTLRQCM